MSIAPETLKGIVNTKDPIVWRKLKGSFGCYALWLVWEAVARWSSTSPVTGGPVWVGYKAGDVGKEDIVEFLGLRAVYGDFNA